MLRNRLYIGLLAFSVSALAQSHQATLNYQNATCTNHSPCSLVVWRAICSTATSCPRYQAGSNLWTRVNYGIGSAKPTATGTTWVVYDQDPTLQNNTTYAYCATNAFQSKPNVVSDCGPVWSGTTGSGARTPPAPTVGTNNSVN